MSHAATPRHDLANDAWEDVLTRLQRPALWFGVGGLVVALIIAIFNFDGFLRSYIMAFAFWAVIPLGSLALLMLQHMTGGNWGLTLRRFLEAASWLILLTAVLSLPILIAVLAGRNEIYPWLPHGDVEGNFGHFAAGAGHHLDFKRWWLSPSMFILRTCIYFGLWIGMALYLYGWSGREDRNGASPEASWRARRVSAPGILIWGLSVSFAVVDWIMSLDPSWYSTIWGILFIVGSGLSTLAFMIAIISLIAHTRPIRDLLSPGLLNDLGNLLMAFTMLWAYINFSQFLIMWSGNIAEEVPYYFFRTRGGWAWIALFLVVFHFFAPFTLLLWRKVKRDIRLLAMVAIAIFCVRAVDLFWVVKPMFLQREYSLPSGSHGPTHGPAGGATSQPAHAAGVPVAPPAIATQDGQGRVQLAAFADPAPAAPSSAPAGSAAHPAGDAAPAPDADRPHEAVVDAHGGTEKYVRGVGEAMDWADLPALLGIGGIFVFAFVWKLKQRPLVAPNDPRVAELAEAGHH